MRAYDAVLYDNDGTLVDTFDLIMCSMRYTAQHLIEREVPDWELSRGIGTPLYDQMLVLAEGDAAFAERLTAFYREHNHSVHDDMVKAFPSVADMLEAVRAAGLAQGVVTSKMHALCARGLSICGLDGYMDVLIGPDDCPEHKPAPGPVLEGCRRLGVAPERCLYVGDSPFDLQAGNAAGCATVAVSWGVFPLDVLSAENPTYTIAAPADLLGLI